MTAQTEKTLQLRRDFHERIQQILVRALEKGAEVGVVAEAMSRAAEGSARVMVDSLADDRPRMLAEHALMWKDVEDILRETWGGALDRLYSVVVAVEELARGWDYANHADAEADGDLMFQVMSSLLARAIRTAFEVHLLLTRGFPAGATARARSLHELAVVARVMVQHGNDHDLPTRYVDHRHIDQYLWVQNHQEHAEDLGREPFTADEVKNLTAMRDHLVAEHGAGFGQAYGWAAPLFTSGGGISVLRLAGTVDMDWGRPDYVGDSQEVHPTAWGAELNQELDGQVGSWRLTGLADPANSTMVRLCQVLGDGLVYGRPDVVNQYDVLGLATAYELVEDAQATFVAAERSAAERIVSDPLRPDPPTMRSAGNWATTPDTAPDHPSR